MWARIPITNTAPTSITSQLEHGSDLNERSIAVAVGFAKFFSALLNTAPTSDITRSPAESGNWTRQIIFICPEM